MEEQEEKTIKKKKSLKSVLIETAIYLVVIFLAVFIIPRYLVGRVAVDGQSMMNTLNDGDQLLGEHFTAYSGNFDRYDIIFFRPVADKSDTVFIKRIIGLPGESVHIDEYGTIYINGDPLDEDFGREKINNPGRAAETIQLAEDEFFVLGDNRNHSTDSRSAMVGNVKRENIDGVAFFRIWPFSDIGPIE